jgi:hypothetical protein
MTKKAILSILIYFLFIYSLSHDDHTERVKKKGGGGD